MVFHLYLPSYVSANGTWHYDATLQAFAFIPNAVDWIYSHLFLLSGEPAARLYNFAALMLLGAMIYRLTADIASRATAVWTATLFISIPLAFIESSSLFIETTLALWLTSATGVFVATNLRPDVRARARWLLFSWRLRPCRNFTEPLPRRLSGRSCWLLSYGGVPPAAPFAK